MKPSVSYKKRFHRAVRPIGLPYVSIRHKSGQELILAVYSLVASFIGHAFESGLRPMILWVSAKFPTNDVWCWNIGAGLSEGLEPATPGNR